MVVGQREKKLASILGSSCSKSSKRTSIPQRVAGQGFERPIFHRRVVRLAHVEVGDDAQLGEHRQVPVAFGGGLAGQNTDFMAHRLQGGKEESEKGGKRQNGIVYVTRDPGGFCG